MPPFASTTRRGLTQVLGAQQRLRLLMKNRGEFWVAVAVFMVLMSLSTLNRLYRVSSREGIPMFSSEALAAGWLYWLGMAIGLVGAGLYYLNKRD